MPDPHAESLVAAVAQLCAERLPLEQTFEGFCSLIAQAMPAPVVILMVRVGNELRVEEYFRQDSLLKPDNTLLPPDSISAIVMRTMQPQLFVQDEDWPERTTFTFGGEGVPVRSAMFVPLIADGVAAGVLTVQAFIPDAYRERDVDLLEQCAPYFAARVRAEFSGRFE